MRKRKVLLTLGVLALGACALTSCGFFNGGDDYSISEVTTSVTATGETVVTIAYTDSRIPSTTFTIPKGESGNGIASIVPTVDEDGKTVTVTISYTDGREPTVYTYPIIEGRGISSVEFTYQEGSTTQVYSFHLVYSDGTISNEIVLPKGNGISTLVPTVNEDGSTTILITMEDGTEISFTIPKGEKGEPGDDGFSPEISAIYRGEDGVYHIIFTTADGGTKDVVLDGLPMWEVAQGNPNDQEKYDNYPSGYIYVDTLSRIIYFKTVSDGWVVWVDLGQKAYYSVSFHVGNGTIDESELIGYTIGTDNTFVLTNVEEGKTIDLPTPVPNEEGQSFAGWFTSTDLSDVNVGQMTDLTPVTRDLDLYAIYR